MRLAQIVTNQTFLLLEDLQLSPSVLLMRDPGVTGPKFLLLNRVTIIISNSFGQPD